MIGFKKRLSSQTRPVFLDLTKIHLPLNAFVSIMHRISGVVFVYCLPFFALMLYILREPSRMLLMDPYFESLFLILPAYAVSCLIMFHVLAGLRHMFHDFSSTHGLKATKISSVAVLILWFLWLAYTVFRFVVVYWDMI